MPPESGALGFLVDPVSPSEFVAEYWERTPLYLQRDRPDYFDDVFTFDALDALLARGDVWHPNVRVFLAGEQLPTSRFSSRWPYGREVHDRLVDRNELLRLFRAGATVNVLGLERTSARVMSLSKRLEIEAGFPVHTTVFLSPPDATNIPPHYDMVDVLVAQISGTKEWGLWEPHRALPLTTDTAGRLYTADDERVAPDRLIGRHVLQPGDTLYVPRGVLHEAITTDETSVHLAFGINPHRWYDVLEAVAKHAVARLADRIELRHALPIGYHENGRARDGRESAAMLGTIAEEFAGTAQESLEVGLRVLDERYIRSRHASRSGQLRAMDHLPSVGVRDRLVARSDLAYGIDYGGGRARLIFHQKTLTFGTQLHAALQFVASGRRFAIAEIPGLSDEQRVQFSRRLVAEGFLVPA